MRYKLENKNDTVIFTLEEKEYELSSHPYEPCLYICGNGEIIKILHNAFEVCGLVEKLDAGETVTAPDSRRYDKDSFCKVLAAALNDSRYEMNWTFAADMV